MKIALNDISIRTTLKAGDLGYITYLHGSMYSSEYGYGISFEAYVGKTLAEFYEQFNPANNRIWICEHQGKIVGCIALMNRGDEAQLRYFLVLPEYRGIGLGKKLMSMWMDFMRGCNYRRCYLMTTDGLPAAASLYSSHGFKLTEEIPSTAFGKTLVELRYDWSAE